MMQLQKLHHQYKIYIIEYINIYVIDSLNVKSNHQQTKIVG